MGRRLLLVVFAACGTPPVPPVAPAGSGVEPPAFRVDVTPPATCAHATTCEARLVLVAQGDYKVNAEYPFKFVGDVGPAITFDGTGTFAPTDAKTGTLTIKFRSEAAGTIEVSGTFKLSVCTEDVCKIEQPKITFEVPVS